MTETQLSKIEKVTFSVEDGRIGLRLAFATQGSGVATNYLTWDPSTVEVTERTKWSEKDRDKELASIMRKVLKLLKQAKVPSIRELKDIPVEIQFESNLLLDWRILEEVL